MPGWQLNHCGDPDRGTGRIYGNRNTNPDVDAIRAEIGWVRDGFQTYAYAFRPNDDFADLSLRGWRGVPDRSTPRPARAGGTRRSLPDRLAGPPVSRPRAGGRGEELHHRPFVGCLFH